LTLEAELADVPKPQIIPAGYPMLTLLASDSSPQLLRQKLQAVAAYVYEILS
jgi:predicted ATP-grasp superfamily ATP-dependent carboligase